MEEEEVQLGEWDMKCNFNKELKLGMKVEREHSHLFAPSKRKLMQKKIALDHIRENSCYYSKGLIPLEKKFKQMKGGIK